MFKHSCLIWVSFFSLRKKSIAIAIQIQNVFQPPHNSATQKFVVITLGPNEGDFGKFPNEEITQITPVSDQNEEKISYPLKKNHV